MLKIVQPDGKILTPLDAVEEMPLALERAGRTCYQSHDRTKIGSAERFVRMICRNHHESVLEHCSITTKVTCSRACSHQLVRHRLVAYSQESQRYVNYKGKGFEVICPPSRGLSPGTYAYDGGPCNWIYYPDDMVPRKVAECSQQLWLDRVKDAIDGYKGEIIEGAKPEDARYLLPAAVKTEVVVTANLRMWRHIFRERALNPKAQWEIRGIFLDLFKRFCQELPCVFEDLEREQ